MKPQRQYRLGTVSISMDLMELSVKIKIRYLKAILCFGHGNRVGNKLKTATLQGLDDVCFTFIFLVYKTFADLLIQTYSGKCVKIYERSEKISVC